jgi:hypothetical protein
MTRAAIAACAAIFAAHLGLAQDVTGNWVAYPAESGALRHAERFVLKLSRDRQGVLGGTMASGHFGDDVFQCASISFRDSKLSMVVELRSAVRMAFNGTMSADGKSIAGWMQGSGFNERLKFERLGRVETTKVSPEKPSAPAAAAPTNDAPPAITADATAASPALLSRALEKLSGTRRLLQKYTCLETIERSYYSQPTRKMGTDVMTSAPQSSCKGREFDREDELILTAEDRLRLEVAVADGKEIDSWAAADRFDSRSIHDMVSTGPTSTGAFGTLLVDIFENPGAHYAFLGKKTAGSREVFGYSFDVPLGASNYLVKVANGWRKTAYRGTFEIDAASAELSRLVTETADLAPETQACRYRTATDYHYAPIGDGQYLIPIKSALDGLFPNGTDHSAMVFSDCHEYGAVSSLILEGDVPRSAAEVAPKAAQPLQPGLQLTLALVSPIDTRTAAAGDSVSAKVTKAVRAPGSDEILVAQGAVAHGRILQMRHEIASAQFLISIHFDTLEQNGAMGPLTVRSDRELKAEQAQTKNRFASRGTEFGLPAPAPASETGSWFTLSAADGRATLAAGSESKWITVAK